MKVDIRAHNLVFDDNLRTYLIRKAGFGLGRLGERVSRVSVRFVDINGPRGGIDKRCRIDVSVLPLGNVCVDDVDSDLFMVIDRAVDRAARTRWTRARTRARGFDENEVHLRGRRP